MCACVLSHFSCVWLFSTLWTVAHQGSLSMGFSRQEHWSGLLCPLQGVFPTQGSNSGLMSPELAGSLLLVPPLLLFSLSAVPNSLWPNGLQHTWLPCPSSQACPDSCPLSQWCHPIILSSVVPFSSCLQFFPASGSFPVSLPFISGGQSIGVSASVSALPMNIQDWLPLGLTGWISLQSKGLSRVFSNTTQFEGINSSVLRFLYSPTLTSIHDYGKNHSFDYMDLWRQSNLSVF